MARSESGVLYCLGDVSGPCPCGKGVVKIEAFTSRDNTPNRRPVVIDVTYVCDHCRAQNTVRV
jgi:hypothetical protein